MLLHTLLVIVILLRLNANMNERNMYVLRKNSALWQVFHRAGGKALFSSLSRARCNAWLDAQFPKSESE